MLRVQEVLEWKFRPRNLVKNWRVIWKFWRCRRGGGKVDVSDFYEILIERFFLSEKRNPRAENHEEILLRVS